MKTDNYRRETVTPEVLRRMYHEMLRIRMIEEKIADLYPEQEMRCPVHLSIGQEAVAVGVCAALTADDYVLSSHRSHAHYLAKGGNLNAMMAEIYGKTTGCCSGKGGSMHLIDLSVGFLGATPIVGSTIPMSVGTALASSMRGEPRVSVAFMGDGAAEEGVFHESLSFALLKNLPVIFVCENNLYSVYSPLCVRQPACREITDLAKGHGVESFQCDGNDVVQVFEMASKAAAKARAGGGPTFLEFKTYRWREHCGPDYDNDLGYRCESEFLDWKKRDPIETLKRMHGDGLFDRDTEAVIHDLSAEIEEAVAFAKKSPFPEEPMMLQDVYV
ncbi:MAG TPA: thiamine pyrophosphate-dependent dehydrogenase E1 component subunit alpha [Deltaproteobacteria bacterium]|jgi:pyruvate dehydrogenase E1 component alpha subunit|nr:thiamine pyrophosphate-dependent dehydrogenase E1 component subunit alpha [Deltaproteobacteria bacterium]